MFYELIIKAMPELVKFFETLNMQFYFTPTQCKNFQAFIVAMMLKGFSGKMKDVSELSLHAHRTSFGRFLDSSAWDSSWLLRAMNRHVIEAIWEKAKKERLPIYVIIDDTICEKAKPSSKVNHPIYGCGFHKSHLKNKSVYGHQFVCCMLQCGDLILPFDIVLYDKGVPKQNVTSKIEISKNIIHSLPKPIQQGYVVCDSWYSCKALFLASKAKGYHFIGGLKLNRLIFPRGFGKKGIKISSYAHLLRMSDFDLVTVGKHRYYVYTYLGRINGQNKVKITITWPKSSFGIVQTMRAFVSTDIKMHAKQLFVHYSKRWPVEVFFRESNRYLGMKQSQVRSKKAVLRYQYILFLTYIFCGTTIKDNTISLGKQRHKLQKTIERFRIVWLYEQVQKGASLERLLEDFHLV